MNWDEIIAEMLDGIEVWADHDSQVILTCDACNWEEFTPTSLITAVTLAAEHCRTEEHRRNKR